MTDFGRVYRITARRAAEPLVVKGLNSSWFDEFEEVIEISNVGKEHYHRVEFEIDKDLKGTPNQCKLTIYNLSTPSRDLLTSNKLKVRLEAGYGDTPRLMFIGDLRYASNEYKGTEWMTKLQLADGGRAYANAQVNQSFARGTPLRVVLGKLADAFKVPLELQSHATSDLEGRIASGEVVTGYVADEMDRLLAPFGLGWSFQNGRLQVLPFDKTSPGEIRVIREDTGEGGGMLGSPDIEPPKISAPRKAGRHGSSRAQPKVPKLKVKHTLYPELIPGERIQLQSRSINGTFKIDALKHKGDTHGDEWATEIQASDVPDVTPI